MLAEEDRARIRAEEIFRLEVRRELEASQPRPSRRQRLGSWVNSSFGLWVLSSVVLTGLTTAYTYYQSRRAEQVRNAETERRLDTEISGRMSAALALLRIDEQDAVERKRESSQAVDGSTELIKGLMKDRWRSGM